MQQKVLMLTSSGLNKSQINVSWINFVQFMLGSVTLQLIFLWIWRPKADIIVICLHFGESFTRPYMILQNFTHLAWKLESIQLILNKLTLNKIIWAEIFKEKYLYLFADKPCDLPHIENGKIAQYYYSFKSYYFPMHKEKKLSYSCMIGYTTESGTQDGRITCTAKGWSPVPRCYSELALLTSVLLLLTAVFPWTYRNRSCIAGGIKCGQGEINPLCIQTTHI